MTGNVQSKEKELLSKERNRLHKRLRDLETILNQNEQQLNYMEKHYKELVEKAGIAILTDDEEGNIKYFNKRLYKLFGYTADEMKGKAIQSIVHQDSIETVMTFHKQRVQGKEVPSKYEFKGIRKNGSTMYLEVDVVELVEGGDIIGTRSYLWDVTERRQTEEALRESESRYRILIEHASDGIFIADMKGNCVDVNKNGCNMMRYKREEILRLSLMDMIPEDNLRANLKRLKELTSGKEVVKEYMLKRKDGSVFPAEVSAKLLPDKRLLGFVRDITERKRMEEELLKIQKLESIGMLAGGIAHDFNNILTGVLGNISLAKLHTEAGSPAYEKMELAEKASLRAKDLVNQFITFSRGGKPIKKTKNIAEFLEDTVNFTLSGSWIKCDFFIDTDLLPVEIDAGQVRQVFHNIAINAKDAMPKGGRLEVRAKNYTIGNDSTLPLETGEYVRISFKDQGPGIYPYHLPRLFDPYFTTREKRRGMGLSAAYSIMKNHEGCIHVESEKGKGAVFQVYFPAAEKEDLDETFADYMEPSRFKGKILVMDDEFMVREVAGEMLEFLGFDVTFAENGAEAIEKYKKELEEINHPFDAVIMDLTIPDGMGGLECIKKLLEIDPSVKALVSSGYSHDSVMSNFHQYGFKGIVHKPYKTQDLKEILGKIL
jgi:PAS domain S-box-containing protein